MPGLVLLVKSISLAYILLNHSTGIGRRLTFAALI